jgi:hypothetical protein
MLAHTDPVATESREDVNNTGPFRRALGSSTPRSDAVLQSMQSLLQVRCQDADAMTQVVAPGGQCISDV